MPTFRPATLLCVLAILGYPTMLAAQTAPAGTSCLDKELPSPLVRRLLSQYFSVLLGSQSSGIGSFLALDVKESSLSLAASTAFRSGSILSVKARGAATDGVLAIARNAQLNTELGVEVQYNRLALAKRRVSYDDSVKVRYCEAFERIRRLHGLRLIDVANDLPRLQQRLDSARLREQEARLMNARQGAAGARKRSRMRMTIGHVLATVTTESASSRSKRSSQSCFLSVMPRYL